MPPGRTACHSWSCRTPKTSGPGLCACPRTAPRFRRRVDCAQPRWYKAHPARLFLEMHFGGATRPTTATIHFPSISDGLRRVNSKFQIKSAHAVCHDPRTARGAWLRYRTRSCLAQLWPRILTRSASEGITCDPRWRFGLVSALPRAVYELLSRHRLLLDLRLQFLHGRLQRHAPQIALAPVPHRHRPLLRFPPSDNEHIRDQLELGVADLGPDLLRPVIARHPQAGIGQPLLGAGA